MCAALGRLTPGGVCGGGGGGGTTAGGGGGGGPTSGGDGEGRNFETFGCERAGSVASARKREL